MAMLSRPCPVEWIFYKPHAALAPGAHMLTVSFEPGGRVCFGSATASPEILAERLRWLAGIVTEHPEIADAAAGIEGTSEHLFDQTIIDEDW